MANDFKYRADHIGRLVPPPNVEGEDGAEILRRILAMQKACGVSVATDGEIVRGDLPAALLRQGLEGTPPRLFDEEAAPALALNMTAVALKVSLPAPSAALVRLEAAAAAKGQPFDLEVAGPAVAKALRAEVDALLAGGTPYVQLNGAAYSALLSEDVDAARFEALLTLDRAVLEAVAVPEGGRLALRVGDLQHGTGVEGRLATVLALPAQRFLFSFEGPAPDFGLLALAREDADLVLGLVDNEGREQQDPDELMAVIDRAALVVDADRLALSPRGGFVPTAGANWDLQRRKLEQTADVAVRYWGFAM